MFFELAYHYFTIIVFQDYTGFRGFIAEDSPLLNLAYHIAGL